MPSTTSPPPSQSSGIQTTVTGERHIPQSVRSDGSLRKEIRIRPGYRPPEDVEVYKNRTAEAWKSRGTGGVPGAGELSNEDSAKSSAGKNAKRREARKKAKATECVDEGQSIEGQTVNTGSSYNTNDQSSEKKRPSSTRENLPSEVAHPLIIPPEERLDPEAEKEKQARNLKKKLRQARDLEDKKDSGESLLPEQFAKVIKIQELIRQLDALGFDSDGARKAKDVR